ncbi:hypothetical protein HDU76_010616 [Blyttiomyces sp. JEL0837]|nr:hypothetical protein HDU76_010616 [Blyttiomyces sp. JEL0837]
MGQALKKAGVQAGGAKVHPEQPLLGVNNRRDISSDRDHNLQSSSAATKPDLIQSGAANQTPTIDISATSGRSQTASESKESSKSNTTPDPQFGNELTFNDAFLKRAHNSGSSLQPSVQTDAITEGSLTHSSLAIASKSNDPIQTVSTSELPKPRKLADNISTHTGISILISHKASDESLDGTASKLGVGGSTTTGWGSGSTLSVSQTTGGESAALLAGAGTRLPPLNSNLGARTNTIGHSEQPQRQLPLNGNNNVSSVHQSYGTLYGTLSIGESKAASRRTSFAWGGQSSLRRQNSASSASKRVRIHFSETNSVSNVANTSTGTDLSELTSSTTSKFASTINGSTQDNSVGGDDITAIQEEELADSGKSDFVVSESIPSRRNTARRSDSLRMRGQIISLRDSTSGRTTSDNESAAVRLPGSRTASEIESDTEKPTTKPLTHDTPSLTTRSRRSSSSTESSEHFDIGKLSIHTLNNKQQFGGHRKADNIGSRETMASRMGRGSSRVTLMAGPQSGTDLTKRLGGTTRKSTSELSWSEKTRKLMLSNRKMSVELEEIKYANLISQLPRCVSVYEFVE